MAIELVRLTEVPLTAVRTLLNEPRNARHMPLAGDVTDDAAARWVAEKDEQWERHGYGPWAVLLDGVFAGWGGFQCESNGADLALVLLPQHWGHGRDVITVMLECGFGELGLEDVIVALPYTRRPERAMSRLGFRPDGEVRYDGTSFRQYRLTRQTWSERDR